MIDILYLIQHLRYHQEGNDRNYNVDRHDLYVPIEINYDNYSKDEEEVYCAYLKMITVIYCRPINKIIYNVRLTHVTDTQKNQRNKDNFLHVNFKEQPSVIVKIVYMIH